MIIPGIEIIFFVCTLFVMLYVLLIIYFIFGWRKMKKFVPGNNETRTSVSVIIAARNEEKNISGCIRSVLMQDISATAFEVIVIDDHSEDNTSVIINEFLKKNANLRCLHLVEGENGKKAAITKGIDAAEGKLIVLTDADCIVGKKWLSTISSFFEKQDPEMILLPVLVKAGGSFFGKVQALESLSLAAVTGASANLNMPLLSNGAGIVYAKKTFEKSSGFSGNEHFPGGDDMMMMQKIKALHNKKIKFLFSDEVLVETAPVIGIKAFFDQRIRWASKTKHYSDKITGSIALLVLLASVSLVFTGVLGLLVFKEMLLLWSAALFIFKAVFDFLFLFLAAKSFRRTRLLTWFLPVQMIYPFYILITGLFSLFRKYKWKGRSYSN